MIYEDIAMDNTQKNPEGKPPVSLKIRYIKLHFTIRFQEDTELPINKVSALRGGMGEMLLRANCIRDRNCDACDFETECIVRRTMYSKMAIEPKFMSAGDSVGYVLECENYQTEFQAGDELTFNLILFGKTCVYFSQYLNAFYALGLSGLGKNRSHFRVTGITNSRNEPILDGNDIHMPAYHIQTVEDYVHFRTQQLLKNRRAAEGEDVQAECAPADKTHGMSFDMKLQSPMSIKYRGQVLSALSAQAMAEAIARRIYILDCFEGIEASSLMPPDFILPQITDQQMHSVKVERYSFRKSEKMSFSGFEGIAHLAGITPESLSYLLAGELIHIGKNTSFGFGRYRILPGSRL